MTVPAHPCALCGNDLADRTVVCAGCTNRGARDLADLPRLADTLTDLARDPGAQSWAEPVSGSREKPLPLKTDIWSFVGLAPPEHPSPSNKGWRPGDELCQVGDIPLPDALFSWCRLEAEEFTLTPPRARRNTPDKAVRVFARYLSRQHQRACSQPWADAYLTEIHDLWRRARTLAQDWPLVHRLPAWCPYCQTLTLRRDNGASFVYCDDRDGGCGRRWSESDYERLVLILVGEAKVLGYMA